MLESSGYEEKDLVEKLTKFFNKFFDLNKKSTKLNPKYLLFLPLLIYFGRRSLIAYDEGFYMLFK